MHELIELFRAHPYGATLAAKALWDAFVGAFDAPGKDSSAFYKFIFTFVNLLAFNFQRAKGSSIEQSPNFLPAMQKFFEANMLPMLQQYMAQQVQPLQLKAPDAAPQP